MAVGVLFGWGPHKTQRQVWNLPDQKCWPISFVLVCRVHRCRRIRKKEENKNAHWFQYSTLKFRTNEENNHLLPGLWGLKKIKNKNCRHPEGIRANRERRHRIIAACVYRLQGKEGGETNHRDDWTRLHATLIIQCHTPGIIIIISFYFLEGAKIVIT